MKITAFAIKNLRKIVSGDDDITPKQSGRELVAFFGNFGVRDVYKGGLPDGMSRNDYIENRLESINGAESIAKLLEELVSDRHFDGSDLKKEVAIEKINTLINPDGYGLSFIGGRYQITGNSREVSVEVKNEVHFEDIQYQILAELDNAKYTIWVAVAWFTSPVLFDKLLEKKSQGVNVQILILDDNINSKARTDLDFEGNFETRRLPKTGYFGNITHHKFCVIDLERTINGSYNWTVKAQYNEENITIMDDRKATLEFADRFMKIKNE